MNKEVEPGEVELARLLRAAGPRSQPDAVIQAAVHAAVEAEWREVVAARKRQRRTLSWAAAAATVSAVALGWWLAGSEPMAPDRAFARAQQHSGAAQRLARGERSWRAVEPGGAVMTGDQIRTGPDGRLALALDGGPSLRLDHHTVVTIDGTTQMTLTEGAVYVDSHDTPRELIIETPLGAVKHLGTRYQLRLDDRQMLVAVRDGQVSIAGPSVTASVQGGEKLVWAAGGEPERSPLTGFAPEWAWADALAPPPQLDGMTLHDFASWAARETGRELGFESPAAEQAARSTILHGSVSGLDPERALAAIMRTTRLQHTVQGGLIRLGLVPDQD